MSDESGWWVASVRGVWGCHTQGRTVDEARRRIREALELFVDDARKATLVDEVKLPTGAARAVRAYATLRKKAEQEGWARRARCSTRSACVKKRALEDECSRCRAAARTIASARAPTHAGRSRTIALRVDPLMALKARDRPPAEAV